VLLAEIVFGSLLVGVLLALAAYYGRRQVQALRALRLDPGLPDEERRYERRKAYRRAASCVLLVVLAALLTGLLAVAAPASRLLAEEREHLGPDVASRYTEEEKAFLRFYGWGWIAFLVVLSVVLVLAAADMLSTRRYALRQFRRLHADRRAMIARQANRLRRERNGHG
jgi:hypothetical protein